mmetsp:Transcript_2799/g.7250  ORF Transcript_2799/g.7250 Transcript_2799/m.7250 type:complete len:218 (+) Transcript_2799:91-744(+)
MGKAATVTVGAAALLELAAERHAAASAEVAALAAEATAELATALLALAAAAVAVEASSEASATEASATEAAAIKATATAAEALATTAEALATTLALEATTLALAATATSEAVEGACATGNADGLHLASAPAIFHDVEPHHVSILGHTALALVAVDEDVAPCIGDEAEALLRVEELHNAFASRHRARACVSVARGGGEVPGAGVLAARGRRLARAKMA